jgi:hypothetical protein
MSHIGNVTGNYLGNFAGHGSANYSKNDLWSPIVLNPLFLFEAESNKLQVEDNAVVSIYDQSQHKRNAIAATTQARPSFSTVYGGAINFVQQNLLSFSQNLLLSGNFTLFTFMANNGGSIFVPFDTNASTPTTSNNLKYMWFNGWGQYWTSFQVSTSPIVGTTMTNQAPYLQVLRRDDNILTFWENANQTNMVANATTCNILDAGGSRQTSLPTNYFLMAAGIFDKALLTSEIQKIQGWIPWKRGLQNILPASHPYRNRPPLVGD